MARPPKAGPLRGPSSLGFGQRCLTASLAKTLITVLAGLARLARFAGLTACALDLRGELFGIELRGA